MWRSGRNSCSCLFCRNRRSSYLLRLGTSYEVGPFFRRTRTLPHKAELSEDTQCGSHRRIQDGCIKSIRKLLLALFRSYSDCIMVRYDESERQSIPMKLHTSELTQICVLLCTIHFMASGGQVLTTKVEDEGTKSWVYSMLFTSISGASLTLTCIIFEPRDFSGYLYNTYVDGNMPLFLFLAVSVAIKAISFMAALEIIGALNAVIYIPIVPVAATTASRLAGMEGALSWKQLFGIAMAFSGALYVTIESYSKESASANALEIVEGNLLMVIYVCSCAVQIVFTRTLVLDNKYKILSTNAYILSFGALFIDLVGVFFVSKRSYWDISSLAWIGIAYSCVYSSLTALCDSYAVTRVTPSFVASWLVLEPLFTALISAVAVGKYITLYEIIGGVLTCSGLAIFLSHSYGPHIQASAKVEDKDEEHQDTENENSRVPMSDQTPLLSHEQK